MYPRASLWSCSSSTPSLFCSRCSRLVPWKPLARPSQRATTTPKLLASAVAQSVRKRSVTTWPPGVPSLHTGTRKHQLTHNPTHPHRRVVPGRYLHNEQQRVVGRRREAGRFEDLQRQGWKADARTCSSDKGKVTFPLVPTSYRSHPCGSLCTPPRASARTPGSASGSRCSPACALPRYLQPHKRIRVCSLRKQLTRRRFAPSNAHSLALAFRRPHPSGFCRRRQTEYPDLRKGSNTTKVRVTRRHLQPTPVSTPWQSSRK